MKLYLSSIRIPDSNELARLVGKPLSQISVALIPNAQDYFSERARDVMIKDFVNYGTSLGLNVETVDLRNYNDPSRLRDELAVHNLIWSMGGNTFCLRYEMKRSGFDEVIAYLLENGVTYGGDSAGALVAGVSIGGIESADNPKFAEEVINSGLSLVPYVVLPHADNPKFAEVLPAVKSLHKNKSEIIELNDAQAVIFNVGDYRIIGS